MKHMPHLQSVAWYAHNPKLQDIAHYLADEGWPCEAIYAGQMMLTRTPWPGAPEVWCPPSVLCFLGLHRNTQIKVETVFAAYNHYAGPKQIKVWPFNQHEGGGSYQAVDKLQFLHGIWR
jgi:hypothetical protein